MIMYFQFKFVNAFLPILLVLKLCGLSFLLQPYVNKRIFQSIHLHLDIYGANLLKLFK